MLKGTFANVGLRASVRRGRGRADAFAHDPSTPPHLLAKAVEGRLTASDAISTRVARGQVLSWKKQASSPRLPSSVFSRPLARTAHSGPCGGTFGRRIASGSLSAKVASETLCVSLAQVFCESNRECARHSKPAALNAEVQEERSGVRKTWGQTFENVGTGLGETDGK